MPAMADAKLTEIGSDINRYLLTKGGAFKDTLIRQHIQETIVHYLTSTIEGLQDATTKQVCTKHINQAAASLPQKSLLRHCKECLGKGVVEVGVNLVTILRQRTKPTYFTRKTPGAAPIGCHWVCILCAGTCVIRKKASDLQKHLRDAHGFPETQVRDVFNPRSGDALYEHFGPYTHANAKKNGWDVPPEPVPRARGTVFQPLSPKGYGQKNKQNRSLAATTEPREDVAEVKSKVSATLSLVGSTLQGEIATSSKTTEQGLQKDISAITTNDDIGHDHPVPFNASEEPLTMSIELGAQHPEVHPSQKRQISEFDDTRNGYTPTWTVQNTDRLDSVQRELDNVSGVLHPAMFQSHFTTQPYGTVDPRDLALTTQGRTWPQDRFGPGHPDNSSHCEAQ